MEEPLEFVRLPIKPNKLSGSDDYIYIRKDSIDALHETISPTNFQKSCNMFFGSHIVVVPMSADAILALVVTQEEVIN